MKQWMHFDDPVLSQLCTRLINRQLFQLRFLEQDVSEQQRSYLATSIHKAHGIPMDLTAQFMLEGVASNATYRSDSQEIKILKRDGEVIPLTKASEILPISVYTHTIIRPFICWPKNIPWKD